MKEKNIQVKNHVLKIKRTIIICDNCGCRKFKGRPCTCGYPGKDSPDHKNKFGQKLLPKMTTTEISYKLSLARKNILKLINRYKFYQTPITHQSSTKHRDKMLTEYCFQEIRHQFQLRSRGRK